MTRIEKPELTLGNLQGPEGSAFMILGRAVRAAKDAGWTTEEIEAYTDAARAADLRQPPRRDAGHF